MFKKQYTKEEDDELLEILAELANHQTDDDDDELADNLTSEPLPLELFDTFYKKEETRDDQKEQMTTIIEDVKTAIIEDIRELTAEELTEAITQQNKIADYQKKQIENSLNYNKKFFHKFP